MKRLTIFLFLLMLGCTHEIGVSEDGKTERIIKVKKIFKTKEIVLKVEKTEPVSAEESCEKSGFCCGYSYNFDGEYKYSCGLRNDCDGDQEVQYIHITTTYKTVYSTDIGQFISAVHKRTRKEYLHIGICH